MREQAQLKLDKEMRSEAWVKERENLSAQLSKELLPGLLQQAQEEVTSGYKAKLKEELSAEIREENAKRLGEQWQNLQIAMGAAGIPGVAGTTGAAGTGIPGAAGTTGAASKQ